jgi:hypothetical protein
MRLNALQNARQALVNSRFWNFRPPTAAERMALQDATIPNSVEGIDQLINPILKEFKELTSQNAYWEPLQRRIVAVNAQGGSTSYGGSSGSGLSRADFGHRGPGFF